MIENLTEIVEQGKKDNIPLEHYMRMLPVAFNTENRSMLQHAKYIVEHKEIGIDPDK